MRAGGDRRVGGAGASVIDLVVPFLLDSAVSLFAIFALVTLIMLALQLGGMWLLARWRDRHRAAGRHRQGRSSPHA